MPIDDRNLDKVRGGKVNMLKPSVQYTRLKSAMQRQAQEGKKVCVRRFRRVGDGYNPKAKEDRGIIKLKLIEKEKQGFGRYCPTFARAYEGLGEGIRGLKRKQEIRQWVKECGDTNPMVRRNAVNALANAAANEKSKDAVLEALMKALDSKDAVVRRNAAWALGKAAENEKSRSSVSEKLMEALGDKNKDVRGSATWALGQAAEMIDIVPIPALAKMLGDESTYVRTKAIEAFRKTTDYGADIGIAIPALMETLGCGDEDDRKNVFWALGIAALNEKSRDVALEALLEALEDDELDIRYNALKALGVAAVKGADIGIAIPALVDMLGDEGTLFVRTQVTETLSKAVGNEKSRDVALEALLEALEDDESDIRWNASYILGAAAVNEVDIRIAIPALANALRDDEVEIRKNAAGALAAAAIKGADIRIAIPALANALRDAHGDVCKNAFYALGAALSNEKSRAVGRGSTYN